MTLPTRQTQAQQCRVKHPLQGVWDSALQYLNMLLEQTPRCSTSSEDRTCTAWHGNLYKAMTCLPAVAWCSCGVGLVVNQVRQGTTSVLQPRIAHDPTICNPTAAPAAALAVWQGQSIIDPSLQKQHHHFLWQALLANGNLPKWWLQGLQVAAAVDSASCANIREH